MNTSSLETLKIARIVLITLLALAGGTGCQRETQPAGGDLVPSPPPKVLRRARLLFQRPDGIYLVNPVDSPPRRVTPHATYPRWLPDGVRFVFIRDNRVMLHDTTDGTENELAREEQIRAVAINTPSGDILFAAGNGIHRIGQATGKTEQLIHGNLAYELDAHGTILVTTEKLPLRGFVVKRYALLNTGDGTLLGRGCSASLSPDGTLATLNLDRHRELAILDVHAGSTRQTIPAPAGMQLDNQYWSNHPDWIAAVSHGGDILLQRVSDAACWQLTTTGDSDRPDLFIP